MLKWLASRLRRRVDDKAVINAVVVGLSEDRFHEALQLRRDKRHSPLPAPGVYAKKGEWITCEGIGDHPIVRVAQASAESTNVQAEERSDA